MDQSKRQHLIEKIRSLGFPSPDRPLPVVDLEDFFIGNDDLGSIGCNLIEHPGIGEFFATLHDVRTREDTSSVLVEIYEVEESDETMWPFSERVYFVTTLRPDELSPLIESLQASEIEDYTAAIDTRIVVPGGFRLLAAWWD